MKIPFLCLHNYNYTLEKSCFHIILLLAEKQNLFSTSMFRGMRDWTCRWRSIEKGVVVVVVDGADSLTETKYLPENCAPGYDVTYI